MCYYSIHIIHTVIASFSKAQFLFEDLNLETNVCGRVLCSIEKKIFLKIKRQKKVCREIEINKSKKNEKMWCWE
jgi:hypothetical protein